MSSLSTTKAVLTAAIATATSMGAFAQAQGPELGRVINTMPVIQQVAVPRQVCTQQPVAVQQSKSGAGAVLGSIAGGAVGNSVGQGAGRAAATVLGIVGGAMLGDRIEGGGGTQVQNVQQCSTQTFYENRTVAYNVTYEYAGRQYSVQMPSDPGPYVRLQVTPVGAGAAPVVPAQSQPLTELPMQPSGANTSQAVVLPQTFVQTVAMPTVVAAAPTVVYAAPHYRPYYGPYYPPVAFSLRVAPNGYYHHRDRHYWR